MRTFSIILILAGFMLSCKQNRVGAKSSDPEEERIRSQALTTAVSYASARLASPRQSVNRDGIITLTADGMSYIIDPGKITIGEIDEDPATDAIVPLDLLSGQLPVIKEHLVLLNTQGKMLIVDTLTNVIKILRIQNRIIYAEISKVGMDSPTYGCSECIEVVRYLFRDNRLVKVE